jgi:DNA polymerase I
MIPTHHIRAIQQGADCARCPLLGCGAGPVPPAVPDIGPIDLLVVAEAPSPLEVEKGETLIGPAGREIRQALDAAGYPSNQASYTNAILCRPPGGDMERYLKDVKRQAKPSPVDCCRPRLTAELDRARFPIYVGAQAVKAAQVGDSILKLRGTPVGRGLATLHPSFVLRDSGRLMRGVFRFDIAKAVRIKGGVNNWEVDPPFYVVKNYNELHAHCNLLAMRQRIAVDTETDGIDPWTCNIRRIGFGTDAHVCIYSPLSVDGQWQIDAKERERCRALLAEFFALPKEWFFHNFYGYDSIVMQSHGIVVNEEKLFDSLLGHHIGGSSELPHGLDFLGSIYTDAPRWKDDVKHSTTKRDDVLDKYLSFDVVVTALAGPQVQSTIGACNQQDIYNLDVALSRVGRSMAALGVRVDEEKRAAFYRDYTAEAGRLLGEFCNAAGRRINPRSVPQVKELLYEDLGLPILDDFRTDADEPSTAEPALLDLLERGVDERARKVIHALLGFRAADKIITTYLDPRIHADGRIRTTWKVYGTPSGRWSSGDPVNLQNIPDKIREMYIPAPGNVFVAADYSAVELRILALLASDEALIKAFDEFDRGVGPDIHVVNCCNIFQTTPDKVNKEARTFAKRFVYGLGYGAGPPRIFQTMSLLRDDDFKPVFPNLTLSHIEHAYKVYWQAHPAIIEYRKKLIAGWRKTGYIATAWHGRRRYFIGGENHEEMYNHPIQGAAADLQNTAVVKLVESFPFDFANSRGLCLQVHDQLVVECAAVDAERVKTLVQSAMETQIGNMRFPAEVKSGINWKAV